MNVNSFVEGYLTKLKDTLDQIEPDVVASIVNEFEKTIQKKSKIYIIGNGGSAATASHMVNDFGAGLRRRKIRNFDVTSLSDNSASVTAIANDIGYENIFYMQMEGLLSPDDLVVAISCSGTSPNIVKAVDYAKEIGCTIVGVSGFDGGHLKKVSDIKFHVSANKGEYGLVEDVHMILDHIIYSYYVECGDHA